MSAEADVRKTEHVPEWKREEIDELVDFLERYDAVGVVGVAGIPSRQLQAMRSDLHGTAAVRMSRNTLMRRAAEEVDEGLEELVDEIEGQVAFVGTNDNPFSLYRRLEESKTPAPIGAGEVAPNEIVIPEGDTGIDPGPFVGDLQTVGAAARIMEGSIHVTEDSVVCEPGEEVSADLANVLGELGIEPKEVGLDLRSVHADGVLFEPAELDIDVDAYRADVETAATRARNLAVEAAVPTDRTTTTLLATAAGEAKALAVHAAIEDEEVLPDLLARADAQTRAIAAHVDDEEALPEELRDVDVEPSGDEGADVDGAEEEENEADANETDDQNAEADDDTDDDDDGGEALGEMFG